VAPRRRDRRCAKGRMAAVCVAQWRRREVFVISLGADAAADDRGYNKRLDCVPDQGRWAIQLNSMMEQ
jgi:hypothetical protein